MASGATYGGAAAAFSLGWIGSSEFGILAGTLIGLAGLVLKAWDTWRTDRARQAVLQMRDEEHDARMQSQKLNALPSQSGEL